MYALQRIRKAVREQQYRISLHANDEMSEDLLKLEDIESITQTGKVTKKFTHDPRGIRYEVTGYTIDGRKASFVCRFLKSGILRIITAYVIRGEIG